MDSQNLTIGAILKSAASRLAESSETPRLDAELLLANALGITRASLLSRVRESIVPPPDMDALLARRLAHEPIAYILGTQEFYSREFHVRPPILIPRPETEHLVEVALDYLQGLRHPRILDLCTGSGCVGLTIAAELRRPSDLVLTDQNPDALALALENARRYGLRPRLLQGDLFRALPRNEAPFDVIVSNPPYVGDHEWAHLSPDITRYEDPAALLAGLDGLALIRTIIREAPHWLKTGGRLAIEIGESHYEQVAELMHAHGFTDVRAHLDLAGFQRIAYGHRG